MGVDLRLLPIDSTSCWFSHTVLNVERDRDLWPEISALKPARIPDDLRISTYVARIPDRDGETGYGNLDLASDAYGCHYTWIEAGRLTPVIAARQPNHPTTAYLRALPPDTLIVLDWH